MPDELAADRILRLAEVMKLTGRSKSSIYRDERRGTFPKRRRLGANAVGWLHSEIQQWIITRNTVV
ncbi:MAG: helix-turn-helix transcriptional regulator [bacterium]